MPIAAKQDRSQRQRAIHHNLHENLRLVNGQPENVYEQTLSNNFITFALPEAYSIIEPLIMHRKNTAITWSRGSERSGQFEQPP